MKKYLPLLAIAAAVVFGGRYSAQQSGKVDFQRDVQPIFHQNCYGCHGPQQQMNGFRLDRRRDAMRGGTLAMIGPGNSAGSRMYLRLVGNEYGTQMPPTGALGAAQIQIIKDWIDQGAEWPDEAAGETPPPPPDPRAARLMDVLRDGNLREFRTRLAAARDAVNLKGPGGSTPLMYAGLYADAAVVGSLLDAGADPNVRNDAGATALMWAISDVDTTKLLLDRGANVNARSDDGRTPLLIAAGLPGGSPVVKLLLDRGAKLDVKAPALFGDATPLSESMFSGDEATFRLLIDHGADVNAAGPLTLAFALRAQCMPCVETLLKTMDRKLITPVMVGGGPPDGPALATPLLLTQGADPAAKDPQGRTMLMLAAASDAIPIDAVKALLDRGVDVNASTPSGETALGLAKMRGQTPIVELLLKAGAKDVPAASGPSVKPSPAASGRAAVERSLPLLQRNDQTFLKKAGCVSCHNNTLTAMTVGAARKNGVMVNEQIAQAQRATIARYLDTWRERALQGIGIPGDADTVSYILLGLASENHPADAATDAMAFFLKRQQTADGHWRILAHRPPIESNDIEVTAASMRAIRVYAPKARRADFLQAVERAGAWLAKATPVGTEERAFQLLGLEWSGASKDSIAKAGRALVAEQRSDGGWAQIPTLTSDAYATGQALVALAESGAVPTSDPAYQRGVQFLLKTQFEDGSWFVKSRAIPLQPHFESGFPYGHDQFISAAGSNWAAMALALTVRSRS